MHAFNYEEKLRKYNTTQEIIDDYYAIRIQYYKIRKEYILEQLAKELIVLSNKARYILGNLDNTIDLRKKTRNDITNLLEKMKFDKLEDDDHYKYLVKMPMDSVSEENVSKLINDHENKSKELNMMKKLTIQKMWLNELDELSSQYLKYKDNREKSYTQKTKIKLGKKKLR